MSPAGPPPMTATQGGAGADILTTDGAGALPGADQAECTLSTEPVKGPVDPEIERHRDLRVGDPQIVGDDHSRNSEH
jgi:hypothetical protein